MESGLPEISADELREMTWRDETELRNALARGGMDPTRTLLNNIGNGKYALMRSFRKLYSERATHADEAWRVVDEFKDLHGGVFVMRGVGLQQHSGISFEIKAKHWHELQVLEKSRVIARWRAAVDSTPRIVQDRDWGRTVYLVLEDSDYNHDRVVANNAGHFYSDVDNFYPTLDAVLRRQESYF